MIEIIPALTALSGIVGGISEVSKNINNFGSGGDSSYNPPAPKQNPEPVKIIRERVINNPAPQPQQRPLKITINVNLYVDGKKQEIPGLGDNGNIIDI